MVVVMAVIAVTVAMIAMGMVIVAVVRRVRGWVRGMVVGFQNAILRCLVATR